MNCEGALPILTQSFLINLAVNIRTQKTPKAEANGV
jgi:hypothetical protein